MYIDKLHRKILICNDCVGMGYTTSTAVTAIQVSPKDANHRQVEWEKDRCKTCHGSGRMECVETTEHRPYKNPFENVVNIK